MTVANSGSVGMPWDDDPRASYLLGVAYARRGDHAVAEKMTAAADDVDPANTGWRKP